MAKYRYAAKEVECAMITVIYSLQDNWSCLAAPPGNKHTGQSGDTVCRSNRSRHI